LGNRDEVGFKEQSGGDVKHDEVLVFKKSVSFNLPKGINLIQFFGAGVIDGSTKANYTKFHFFKN
jgi:hypothetical protein